MFHVKHDANKAACGITSVDPCTMWGNLSGRQRQLLEAFEGQLRDANAHLNLISRATAAQLHSRHVLHSLALAARPFQDGSTVVDWGTGGGLPAIPLAIAFPKVNFHAVDVSQRKMLAVKRMARRLGLRNLATWTGCAGLWPGWAHYSVSRAVAPLRTLWRWHARIAIGSADDCCPCAWWPGVLSLKGGDLAEEIASVKAVYPSVQVGTVPVAGEGFKSAKMIVHMSLPDQAGLRDTDCRGENPRDSCN